MVTGCPVWADLLSSQDLQQPKEMCVGRIPEFTTGLKSEIISWENTGMTPCIPNSLLESNSKTVFTVHNAISFCNCSKCLVV